MLDITFCGIHEFYCRLHRGQSSPKGGLCEPRLAEHPPIPHARLTFSHVALHWLIWKISLPRFMGHIPSHHLTPSLHQIPCTHYFFPVDDL